ncbi:D-methionine transport system ATP-binding protein [Bradyrhizobium ottawaense]|uniref:D-methionine transport system ATP-binding protein n=2 Tax=Bradyrhizobium TaxID=374 RepID=A0ABV4G4C3_9BRAD
MKAVSMNAHQSLAVGQPIAPPEAISPATAEPDAMVRFAGISKIYPAYRGKPGVNALQDIDFAIPRGSITGVIGRSGAGKSSLVRLINGLEKPTTGRVVVDGRDISALAGRELRLAQRSIGMIFQHFNLLSSRTAADNIALPLEIAGWSKADIKARVTELLALVGIADKHDRYPSELSGGQKQRVGIARALATRPSVLLSDEATSALDPQTTRAILDLLANINRELGVTIVLITHEMSVVRQLAKEVVVLDAGHVVESGHVADIFTHPKHPITQSFLAEVIGDSLPVSLASRIVAEPPVGRAGRDPRPGPRGRGRRHRGGAARPRARPRRRAAVGAHRRNRRPACRLARSRHSRPRGRAGAGPCLVVSISIPGGASRLCRLNSSI